MSRPDVFTERCTKTVRIIHGAPAAETMQPISAFSKHRGVYENTHKIHDPPLPSSIVEWLLWQPFL